MIRCSDQCNFFFHKREKNSHEDKAFFYLCYRTHYAATLLARLHYVRYASMFLFALTSSQPHPPSCKRCNCERFYKHTKFISAVCGAERVLTSLQRAVPTLVIFAIFLLYFTCLCNPLPQLLHMRSFHVAQNIYVEVFRCINFQVYRARVIELI